MSAQESRDESPQQTIERHLKVAMKAREKERVQTLRMLLTAIKNRRIELGAELEQTEFVALVKRAAKQRQEAAEQFRRGDRIELAEQEERELAILQEYLPEQVDEETLRAAVREYLSEHELSGPKAMGQVMPAMMGRFGDRADGKVLSSIVRSELGL